MTIHGFHHSHVSLLVNKGAHMQAVAHRIGDTLAQIQQTYSHFFEDTESGLINLLDI